jgi:hypothetical protein
MSASLWDSVEDPYALATDRSDEDALALALAGMPNWNPEQSLRYPTVN